LALLALFTAFDKFRAALGFRTSSMLLIAQKPSGIADAPGDPAAAS
jgi:hypothetical protein